MTRVTWAHLVDGPRPVVPSPLVQAAAGQMVHTPHLHHDQQQPLEQRSSGLHDEQPQPAGRAFVLLRNSKNDLVLQGDVCVHHAPYYLHTDLPSCEYCARVLCWPSELATRFGEHVHERDRGHHIFGMCWFPMLPTTYAFGHTPVLVILPSVNDCSERHE
jgi:hypothetical protein